MRVSLMRAKILHAAINDLTHPTGACESLTCAYILNCASNAWSELCEALALRFDLHVLDSAGNDIIPILSLTAQK